MSIFCHVRTQSERRKSQYRGNQLKIDGHCIKCRARRNSRNLPNAWDDVLVAWGENRSWKRNRKTQWRSYVKMDLQHPDDRCSSDDRSDGPIGH